MPGSNGRPPACKAGALPTELTAPAGESSIRPVNARLFWKALAVQAIVVAIPFAILGVALSEDFFEDWGWLVGPVIWLACSLVTARILEIPLAYVLFSAVAGGVAGLIVMLVATHWAGMIAALLVFAASCGSYDPRLEAERPPRAIDSRGVRTEVGATGFEPAIPGVKGQCPEPLDHAPESVHCRSSAPSDRRANMCSYDREDSRAG